MNISKRIDELIERGDKLYYEVYPNYKFQKKYYDEEQKDWTLYKLPDSIHSRCTQWKWSCINLLDKVFSNTTNHPELYKQVFGDFRIRTTSQFSKENIASALGVLRSAKEEFDLGFTHKIKHILSVEFFDTILDQAKELLKKGFKDPAAILGRVIIENTLRGLCRRNNIKFKEMEGASTLNERLKGSSIFTSIQFKVCRTNIELGNDAAHGRFDKYSDDDVKKMFEYIENALLIL